MISLKRTIVKINANSTIHFSCKMNYFLNQNIEYYSQRYFKTRFNIVRTTKDQ